MVKHAALLAAASLVLLAGCGQTGPLYLPTPQERGVAPPVSVPAQPASGVVAPNDDAQLRRPTPDILQPRPGTR